MDIFLEKLQIWFAKRGIYVARALRASDIVTEMLRLIWPNTTNLQLIRVGSELRGDGGYLIPDDLAGLSRVFSPGVADSMEFEKIFLSKGIPCELIDGSVDGPPEEHELVRFQKKWLGAESTSESISLSDWVEQSALPGEDLLLQMDIEGSEYESIISAPSDTLERFRIMVIEVHDLRTAVSRSGLVLFRLFMRKLMESHIIVHAHPNNTCLPIEINGLVWPEVLELTLLRKDRAEEVGGPAQLPHPKDQDNTDRAHFYLVAPPAIP